MLEDSLSYEDITNLHLPARYKIEQPLAKGGMGIVLKAEDSYLQRSVAIKLIQVERFNDGEFQERFLREARMLSSLDHPNIVKVLNHGLSESGVPYYVMELLKGDTLAAFLLKNGVLSLGQFRSIFKQILAGLSEAHRHNIVHRDLNSKNIVLVSDSEKIHAKIIDFGISRIDEDASMTRTLTVTGKLIGNPSYMSPEQCKGQRATYSSDIYSVGCLMYECLSGQPPFQGISAMDLMYKHVNEKAPEMEQMVFDKKRKALAKLIDKCMKKDPGERPVSTEELETELAEIFQSITETNEIFIKKPTVSTGSKMAPALISLFIVLLAGASAFFYMRVANENKTAAETQTKTDDNLQLATKHCNKLKKEMDEAFRPDSKNLLRKRLANELKYLAALQMKTAIPGRDAVLASQAEENLGQALLLTSTRADLVELPLRRAECKQITGNFAGAKKDFDLAEENAIQLNRGKVGSWLQIMSLSSLASYHAKRRDLQAANQTMDKLIGLWSNSNNDIYWDNPLETSIGARNTSLILDLATAKFDTEQERITQLTIINKVSKAILGHIASDTLSKRTRAITLKNANNALLLARDNIVPSLPTGAESERLSKQTSQLISEFKPLI